MRQSIRRLAVVLGAVFLESGADLFRPPGRLAERALRQNDSEFFAAVAAGHVFGAHRAQKTFPDRGEALSPAACRSCRCSV